ncbi:cellulase family glycosylhydrolase [Propionispira raffinosivorans]|uniref:cellulase family glycosylhydrolase n=1 Tax=Propionispira raffinosivorans TaxID=86959 RepID=UPI000367AE5D|nr:cellulase family glycosylhydrolase [Propionispira raffinosivorans]
MKRFFSVSFIMLALCLFSIITVTPVALANDSKEQNRNFVTRQGDKLMLNGKEFRFSGSNNYYFHYRSNKMIDDVMDNGSKMGLKVMRCWGFIDGTGEGKTSEPKIEMQPRIGEYAESGFERLDYAIKKANEKGIKLVIVLVNNWDDFGGMNAYVKWTKGPNRHDGFYTNETIKSAYKAYVNHMLNRVNTYTGVKYMDDPTIMTWELTNEARCESDPSGKTLFNWTKEMSEYVKSVDAKHLVALGEEGFIKDPKSTILEYNGSKGLDWSQVIALPTIDYGTVHLYPDYWGDPWKDGVKAGCAWLKAHADLAKTANKPVVFEEYGILKTSVTNRDYAYETWNNLAYELGYSGSMFWLLTGIDDLKPDADGLYPDNDSLRIVYNKKENAASVKIFEENAKLMNGEKVTRTPHIYITAPSKNERTKDLALVEVKVIPYGKEISNVLLSTQKNKNIIMKANAGNYRYDLDVSKEENGKMPISAVVQFKDGTSATTSDIINIRNKQGKLVSEKVFDFNKGLDGWDQNGIYQAEIKDVKYTKEVGNGSLQLDVKFPGVSDWEELRIALKGIDLTPYAGCKYDIYIPKEGLPAHAQLRPYVVVTPGWVKCGVDQNNAYIGQLPTVTFNGKEYVKLQVTNMFNGQSKDKNELDIDLVANMFKYEGPIYFDNIELLKEVD